MRERETDRQTDRERERDRDREREREIERETEIEIQYSPRTYPFDSDIRETFLQIVAYLTEHSLKAT